MILRYRPLYTDYAAQSAELREKLARSEAELTRVRGELETAQRQLVTRTRLHDEDKEKLATAQAALKDAEAKVERLSRPVSDEEWSNLVINLVPEPKSLYRCEIDGLLASRLAPVDDNPPAKEAADGK